MSPLREELRLPERSPEMEQIAREYNSKAEQFVGKIEDKDGATEVNTHLQKMVAAANKENGGDIELESEKKALLESSHIKGSADAEKSVGEIGTLLSSYWEKKKENFAKAA